jgi:hypothetical protein
LYPHRRPRIRDAGLSAPRAAATSSSVWAGRRGAQCHLEVDLPVLAIKLVTSIEELEEASVDAKALREEYARSFDRSRELGEQVAYRFLAFCTNDATEGGS